MVDRAEPTAASADFEAAKARFFAGLASLEHGRDAEAEAHFLAALALVPGRVSTLVNLAATRLRLGRPAEALATADQALAAEPANHDAWLHRATALAQLGRWPEALAGFERALACGGDGEAELWLRHAHALCALDRRGEALASYERALAIDAARPGAWSRYGDLLREAGRPADAAHAFRQAVAHGADPELHAYYLAAVDADAPRLPATAPRAYVQGLFDDYAADFDRHLVEDLGYQAHRVLVQHLRSLRPGRFGSALDLGCGTGLCGPLLKPLADRLEGVDLSAPMLAEARRRGVYDALHAADLLDHLRGIGTQQHDLVVAADVFIYVGDLAPVFAAVHAATRPGALFCFSVEPADPQGPDVRLLPSLRYAHAEPHLRRLAAAHGYTLAGLLRQPLRHDQRRPVDGLYVFLQRD